jgi:hypothetical protein
VVAILALVLLIVAIAAISVFFANKLIGFLLRGEGWFRGSHVSRRENPTLYWWTVGVLTFTAGVTAWAVGLLALILCRIIAK